MLYNCYLSRNILLSTDVHRGARRVGGRVGREAGGKHAQDVADLDGGHIQVRNTYVSQIISDFKHFDSALQCTYTQMTQYHLFTLKGPCSYDVGKFVWFLDPTISNSD